MPKAVDGIKVCAKCRKPKPVSEFHRNKKRGDGLSQYCKPCASEHTRAFRERYSKADPVLPADGEKRCARCKKRKHVDQFPVSKQHKDHCGSYCFPCDKIMNLKSNLPRRYGISYEDYLQLLDSQGGVCAICKKEFKRSPSVDHDHGPQKKVRGLVHHGCNLLIAYFEILKSNPELKRTIISYLQRANLAR